MRTRPSLRKSSTNGSTIPITMNPYSLLSLSRPPLPNGYRRALRRHNEAEQRLYDLQPDPFLWTPDQIKLIDRFQRYLTTRERAFNRAAANYQRFHNDCLRLYEEANQLLEKAYDLVKENPDLAAQWIRDEVPIRLP